MLAQTDYLGISALIGAVAVLVTAFSGLIVGVRNTRRIAATHTMVAQIDAAVNGKPVGVATISEQVRDAVAVLPLLVKVSEDVAAIKAKG